MNTVKTISLLVVCIIFCLLLGGCRAGMQARNVDIKQSLLVNPAILEKGKGDQALYRYANPQADIKKYSKIMIDPVLVDKQGELDAKERENYQKLANNAYVYLHQELKQDYKIIQNPEPGTLRIQMAIMDADSSKPVRNITSTIIPIGIGLSLVKYGATGKMSGVGEITGEFKATDAVTGELLGAALDRRVGGKDIEGMVDRWHHADAALQYWAKGVRYALCKRREGTGCVKP
ncbi:MAG: DUF3313 domain-containing protein [Smithella sp.]